MKNNLIYSMLLLLTSVLFYSCDDFIEIELGNKSITVLAPANNTISSSFNQLFKWEDLKGAEKYQLQIVKPNFTAIQQFVLDTITTATQFSFILAPGAYQWRLRAMNNSSQSEFQTFNLTIDSTLDLSSSTVGLVSPVDNYYSNLMTNTFTWLNMPYADNYLLQISSGTSSVFNQSYPSTIYTGSYTFTSEGVYLWKVLAQNSTSTSGFVTRTITIDTTAPVKPIALFPVADTITANPIPLQWTATTLGGWSHLQISAPNDSLFVGFTKDTTILNSSLSVTYNFYSAAVGQKYFWKVEDIDKAGNASGYFIRRRIKRN